MRNDIDLVVHQELLIGREFHDNDSEVGATQVQGEKFAMFLAIWQVSDVSRETLDT